MKYSTITIILLTIIVIGLVIGICIIATMKNKDNSKKNTSGIESYEVGCDTHVLGFAVEMSNKNAFAPAIDYSSVYYGAVYNLTGQTQQFFGKLPIPSIMDDIDTIFIEGFYPDVMIFNVSFYNFNGSTVDYVFVDKNLKPQNNNPFVTGNYNNKIPYNLCITSLAESEKAQLGDITENVAWSALPKNKEDRMGTIVMRYYGNKDSSQPGGVSDPKISFLNSKTKKRYCGANVAIVPPNELKNLIIPKLMPSDLPVDDINNQNCFQYLPQGPFAGKANIPCYGEDFQRFAPLFKISITGASALWANPSAKYMATCLTRGNYLFYGKKPSSPTNIKEIASMQNADMRFWSINLCEYSGTLTTLAGVNNTEITSYNYKSNDYFLVLLYTGRKKPDIAVDNITYLQWPDVGTITKTNRNFIQCFFRNALSNNNFPYSIDKAQEKTTCLDPSLTCCCTTTDMSTYTSCCKPEAQSTCFKSTSSCPNCGSFKPQENQVSECNASYIIPKKVMKDYYPMVLKIDDLKSIDIGMINQLLSTLSSSDFAEKVDDYTYVGNCV